MTPVSFVNRVVKDKQTCFYLASFNTNTIPWSICFLPRCICFPLFWSPESPRWRSSTRATSFPRVFVAVHWKRTVSACMACAGQQMQIKGIFYQTNTNTKNVYNTVMKALSIDSYSCCPQPAIIDHKQKVWERNAIWGPMSSRSLWEKSSKTKPPKSHLICSKIFFFCLLDHELALFQRAHLVRRIKKQGKPELETNLRFENLVFIVSVPVHLFPL